QPRDERRNGGNDGAKFHLRLRYPVNGDDRVRPMRAQCVLTVLSCQLLACSVVHAAEQPAPLAIGETFTLQSKVLNETRSINVYLPPGYVEAADKRFPVLYMPDGGLAEDFLHIAGLVQVSVGNSTMRPFV